MLVLLMVCVTMTLANPFFFEKMDVQKTALCPDEEARCPADHECCKLEGGKIGCCLQQGVGQKIHEIIGWKQASSLRAANLTVDSPCPDPAYTCPGLQTCCRQSSGYGCCPYDLGNCCSDGLHCCPSGKTCIGSTCY